ncbi:LCP family protein [Candidatus Saccharibacteria bacterium]|nr:LCP family protein [Candidatus Saccharibacteria bacterium]
MKKDEAKAKKEQLETPANDEPELVALEPKKGKKGSAKSKKTRKKRIKLWVSLGLVFILLAGIGTLIFMVSHDLGKSFDGGIFGLLRKEPLRTDANGRTNILVFGLDEGSLTDSLMVVSVHAESGDYLTVSIPRDLYVQHECGRSKINEVHGCALRRGKSDAEAAKVLADKIGEITGVEIQYFARVNFTVIEELVDRVGGIEITMTHAIADNHCNLKYSAGQVVQMDGAEALCFSRARNSKGGYGIGTDHERGLNQQRVLRALQKAAVEDGKLLTPTAAMGTIDSLGNNLRTNFRTNEIRTVVDLLSASGGANDRGEYAFVDVKRGVTLLRDECTRPTTEVACGQNGGQMILVPSGTTDWYDYGRIREYFIGVLAR